MSNGLNEPVLFLDWDSIFFNKRIGRVSTKNMSEQDADQVDAWAVENTMDCLYYLADGSKEESARAAEAHGYHLTDLRLTFAISLGSTMPKFLGDSRFRLAVPSDLPQLRHMAGEYHNISRFYADKNFTREKCRELYQLWIQRDFDDKNHFLWIIERDGEIAGYTSASVDRETCVSEIGLVGVSSKWRGQGIGLQLQLAVLNELNAKGMRQVDVVTQGRNIVAQNLYIKSGYGLKSIDLWYHKWYYQN